MTIQVIPVDPIGGGGGGGGGSSTLAGLSDVSFSGLANNNFMQYDSASGKWKNTVVAAGGVVSVTATAPVVSSNGANPVISMAAATNLVDGYLTAADHTTFAAKQAALTIGNLTEATSSVLTITGGTGSVIGAGASIQVKKATGAVDGYLSAADFTTFSGKQAALSFGNLTEATSSVLTITGGTGAVVGAGSSIQVKKATGAVDGYLAAADFTTFAGKQSALSFGNLTGDAGSVIGVTTGTGAVIGAGTALTFTPANITHSGLGGLTTTDAGHTQFTMNGGRSGGQTVTGDTAASGDLTLVSTAHATKGFVKFAADIAYDQTNHRFGILNLTPGSTFTVGASDQFAIGSTGNITKINNVTYSWPASQASGTKFLQNDGSGNLSWAAGGGGGGTPGGSNNQMQYNNSSSFGGVANSDMSDANGYVFPIKIVFNIPGPRVVQTDCTPWYIVGMAGKITKAWIVAKTAPTGADFIVDISKSTDNGSTWTSIWNATPANRLKMTAASNNGSQTAFDTTTFAAGNLLKIDIAQVGSTIAGSDVTVRLNVMVQNT